MQQNRDWVRPDLVAKIIFGAEGDAACCARCYFAYVPKTDDRMVPTRWKCDKHNVPTEPTASCADYSPNPND
jgi:hypothetical protein